MGKFYDTDASGKGNKFIFMFISNVLRGGFGSDVGILAHVEKTVLERFRSAHVA